MNLVKWEILNDVWQLETTLENLSLDQILLVIFFGYLDEILFLVCVCQNLNCRFLQFLFRSMINNARILKLGRRGNYLY